MDIVGITTFFGFTAAVILISFLKSKNMAFTSSEAYFLGGRSLKGGIIAGSLLLTNLSTEQLIGLNGASFVEGLVPMAWEVFASIAMVILAVYFLPKYLTSGLTTIPEFLEHRFDPASRLMTSVLFLCGYVFVLVPIILYSGSLAISELFSLPELLNVSEMTALCLCVASFGVLGSIYVIFGGLKVVAFSDTLYGIGLIIGGLLIPYYGLKMVGHGDVLAGLELIKFTHPQKFNAIGSETSSVPFSTIWTGMVLVSIFYWCTNQVIVQRALAAENLKEGQKGVLLAGFLKLFSPFIVVLPGIIAFHLFGSDLSNRDSAYPTLVKTVLPSQLVGFFAAVIVGAILSSFSNALNSASTLFSIGIFKKHLRPQASELEVVRTGKLFCAILATVAMMVAPLTSYAPQGLFGYLQEVNGCYTIPILNVLLLGVVHKRLPAFAAKFGLIFGSLLYCFLSFVVKLEIHFLHLMFLIFILNSSLMLSIAYFRPNKKPWVQVYTKQVDITPWKYTLPCSSGIIAIASAIYLEFSNLSTLSFIPLVMFMVSVPFFILGSKKNQTPHRPIQSTPLSEHSN